MSESTKTIAVDIDDTLNDFTATLRGLSFPFDARHGLTEETFARYLAGIRRGEPDPSDRLSSEYSFLRFQVHAECYAKAAARADGVAFMQWLQAQRWQIVICTRRDLRRAHETTKRWLRANQIPFDCLFSATNKIAFCRAWHVPYLVDDDPDSISYGPRYGVHVFYPLADDAPTAAIASASARGFRDFAEVKAWITA